MLYNKFVNKYTVKGKLIAVDPIHVGSSSKNSLNPSDVDDAVLKDSRGLPVIPGSSVKGVVRSYFESVLRSIDENMCCYVMDKNSCCTESRESKDKIREAKKHGAFKAAEAAYECSCEACRLFGGREFAGKLHIKDCYLTGDPSFEFRDGVGIDRKTGAAMRGAKYNFEVVSKDSEFDFVMTAENLDEKQKKYFEFILKALESGELAVGGKTSRGLGSFKVEVESSDMKTAEDMRKLLGI